MANYAMTNIAREVMAEIDDRRSIHSEWTHEAPADSLMAAGGMAER